MSHLGGTKSIEVDAPIEACWALAADVASAPEWQAGMKSMTVLDRDAEGRPSLCETTADAKVKDITTKVRFSYQEPTRVAWTQEEGELKRLDGAAVKHQVACLVTAQFHQLDAGRADIKTQQRRILSIE